MTLAIQEHVGLAALTTLGIGGPARNYTRELRGEDVADAADWALQRVQPLLLVGGGSNLLAADEGWPWLVLPVAVRGIETALAAAHVDLCVGAGEPWDDLVRLTVENGWAGFE